MNTKVLILFFADLNNENVVIRELNNKDNTRSTCVFRSVNVVGSIIRKLHFKSRLPGIKFWFHDWKYNLDEYTTVICIASHYSPQVLKWINRKNSKIRLINYFWDSISISGYPVVEDTFENWSFFYNDCKDYNIRYNPQFFIESVKLPKEDIIYDITYVGADRGGKLSERSELLYHYYQEFLSRGINFYFYYVSNSIIFPEHLRQTDQLTEEEFHRISAQGRVVLDIVESNVQWMTLRPLLALSNQKKLITNNASIMFEPFYSKENVFILGVDNLDKLDEFIFKDFVQLEEDVLKQYEADNWIERFNIE
ncbi:TPA: hypothetical protein ACGO3H_000496 [Streptococcus suis]